MLAQILGLDGIVVVGVVAVVLFGGSQIPKLARSLGSARREFTDGLRGAGTSEAAEGATTPTPTDAPTR